VIKDNIGNRLSEGNFVQLRFPAGLSGLNGRIKSINEGRITRIGGVKGNGANGEVQPGLVTIEILVPVEVDPRTGVANQLSRLWDPEKTIVNVLT
jgi:hypothetical protein